MTDNKFSLTRITTADLDWLRRRAEAHHRSVPGEISAIRELLSLMPIHDVLPHPEGGKPVPVMEMKVSSHGPKTGG